MGRNRLKGTTLQVHRINESTYLMYSIRTIINYIEAYGENLLKEYILCSIYTQWNFTQP
jgi:hypothetical protein